MRCTQIPLLDIGGFVQNQILSNSLLIIDRMNPSGSLGRLLRSVAYKPSDTRTSLAPRSPTVNNKPLVYFPLLRFFNFLDGLLTPKSLKTTSPNLTCLSSLLIKSVFFALSINSLVSYDSYHLLVTKDHE